MSTCTDCGRPIGLGEAQYLDALRRMHEAESRARKAEDGLLMYTTDHDRITAHLGRLLLSDLRYSMGRRSTAPGDCAEGIMALWRLAPPPWRRLLLRDLSERVSDYLDPDLTYDGILGGRCDVDVWLALLAWMRERQDEQRGEASDLRGLAARDDARRDAGKAES